MTINIIMFYIIYGLLLLIIGFFIGLCIGKWRNKHRNVLQYRINNIKNNGKQGESSESFESRPDHFEKRGCLHENAGILGV